MRKGLDCRQSQKAGQAREFRLCALEWEGGKIVTCFFPLLVLQNRFLCPLYIFKRSFWLPLEIRARGTRILAGRLVWRLLQGPGGRGSQLGLKQWRRRQGKEMHLE